jgi:hypothetical protein
MVGCTCLWDRLIIGYLVQVGAWFMHLFMVQFDYRLMYRLMHGSNLLVQVYNSISHSDMLIVVPSFYFYLRVAGWARTGGCSHLLVVAEEHRWLEPPSSYSWIKKEVGASNECNSSRHIRKHIPWFSPNLSFHIKHWCNVYVYVCSFVHCLFNLQLLDDNASLI